jgi:hypothetical protein
MAEFLEKRGMSHADAVFIVIGCLRSNPSLAELSVLGHEGYPPNMDDIVGAILCHGALEWIDKNKPEHWARAMFVPVTEQHSNSKTRRETDGKQS